MNSQNVLQRFGVKTTAGGLRLNLSQQRQPDAPNDRITRREPFDDLDAPRNTRLGGGAQEERRFKVER
ncbi:MAG: hypothetical protein M3407_09580 [Acidobacteriota bacterium]|nr:hypothetical protein [Acidobacteriota bacterium]